MIDYAALAKAGGISKGEPLKKRKARKARADAKGLKAFRDAVWRRERFAFDDSHPGVGWECARCQHCGFIVRRGAGFQDAEVHHRIGRRVKASRYDSANGILLCNQWLNDCHGKAQRKEIQV